MYYSLINRFDIADGPGIRVSLFVSGCRNHCEGCFNPQTWNFCHGQPFTNDTLEEILKYLNNDAVQGFSLLGGDPFEPENQEECYRILSEIKKKYPTKNIWCYTGCTFENLLKEDDMHYTAYTRKLFTLIDVLVDGKFILAQRDITLPYRGSTNQRLIDIRSSFVLNETIIIPDEHFNK